MPFTDPKGPNAWAGVPFASNVTNGQVLSDPTVDAPPPLGPIGMGSGPPPVFTAPPPMPSVSRAPTPIEGQISQANDRLRKLQEKDANPYGSANNHPGIGGKILHALSVAGNIAGDIFAPSTMALIPGTEMNRRVEENSLGSRLQSLTQEQSENDERAANSRKIDADTAKTELETGEEPQKADDEHSQSKALTRHLNDESEGLEDPAPKYSIHDTEAGPLFVNEQTGAAQHLTVDGVPVGPKIKLTQSQPIVGKDGRPHTYMIDEKGNKVVDLGVHYEKPTPEPGSWQLDEGPDGKPIEFNNKTGATRAAPEGLQARGTFAKGQAAGLKLYGPALDSGERFNIMSQNYEDAVKNHDQQAMLSLLSNHLGMTAGLQKGGRITRDMYEEAEKSRPWMAGAKASWGPDGYLSGVTLTPEQMRQMVSLGRDRFQQDLTKARSEAKYSGVTGDGPERTPGPATMRFYLNLAGRNVQHAKALAAEDGWSVQ